MVYSGLGTYIQLLNAAQCPLDSSWHYCNVISPFSRIYLITEGDGYIFPNNQKTLLEAGYLYFIPAFTPCSYTCSSHLYQFYLHFTTQTIDGRSVSDHQALMYKVKATELDLTLFKRLLELNPGIQLKVTDPLLNEQKAWLSTDVKYPSASHFFESIGIIYQLYARFFPTIPLEQPSAAEYDDRIGRILVYIHQRIENDLSVKELAYKACLSADHFTRAFKRTTGKTPMDYIHQKRVEKAQLLLATTNLSLKEIVEKTGFNSASYFNRTFKKASGVTPLEYRRDQWAMF